MGDIDIYRQTQNDSSSDVSGGEMQGSYVEDLGKLHTYMDGEEVDIGEGHSMMVQKEQE